MVDENELGQLQGGCRGAANEGFHMILFLQMVHHALFTLPCCLLCDGQCIKTERRCDQVTGKEPDCRGKSEEIGCQLIAPPPLSLLYTSFGNFGSHGNLEVCGSLISCFSF